MNELLRRRGQEMSEGINWAKALPLLAGGTLITLGVQRRSKVGWLLAAAGGGIATYSLMCEMTEAEPPAGRYVKRAITIGAPPEQTYEFWSKADNLKRMIAGVADIQPSAAGTWNWRFEGPVGTTLEWETEFLENEPGRLMHWQTKGNPVIEHHGRLEFRPAPADRGTEVTFTVSWKPTGPVTQAVSGLGLIGKAAGWHASEALRRAKQLLETGELSTASIGA
jgi:uncharacterized membrane protein